MFRELIDIEDLETTKEEIQQMIINNQKRPFPRKGKHDSAGVCENHWIID